MALDEYDALSKFTSDFYNADESVNLYFHVLGGSHIHTGLYDAKEITTDMDVETRLGRAMELSSFHLFKSVPNLDSNTRVLYMGSGYGGNTRLLSKHYGCTVIGIDITKKNNEINRTVTNECGLGDKLIIPGERSFTDTGEPAASVDVIFSMDAFIYGFSQKEKIIIEAARILKPGGYLAFTDIMQVDGAVVDFSSSSNDIHSIKTYATPTLYKEWCAKHGFTLLNFEDRSSNTAEHYQIFNSQIRKKRDTMKNVSDSLVEIMTKRIDIWIEAALRKETSWGFFLFKRN